MQLLCHSRLLLLWCVLMAGGQRLLQQGRVVLQKGKHFLHPFFQGSLHRIAGEKDAVDGEASFLSLWDRRGHLREQVGVGFDPALQVTLQLLFCGKPLVALPGDLPAVAGVVWGWMLERVIMNIPGQSTVDKSSIRRFIFGHTIRHFIDHVAQYVPAELIDLPLVGRVLHRQGPQILPGLADGYGLRRLLPPFGLDFREF